METFPKLFLCHYTMFVQNLTYLWHPGSQFTSQFQLQIILHRKQPRKTGNNLASFYCRCRYQGRKEGTAKEACAILTTGKYFELRMKVPQRRSRNGSALLLAPSHCRCTCFVRAETRENQHLNYLAFQLHKTAEETIIAYHSSLKRNNLHLFL